MTTLVIGPGTDITISVPIKTKSMSPFIIGHIGLIITVQLTMLVPSPVTDTVKPIFPFIIGYIGHDFIGTDIVKLIYPIINGEIGFTILVTGPETDYIGNRKSKKTLRMCEYLTSSKLAKMF
jgi:hypothetical protein